jgi:two-component sensor histidine kinase
MSDILRRHSDLDRRDEEWLHLLVGDWQLISDLSFADLVLWLPTSEGFVAVAHCRPSTGPTVLYHDIVGTIATRGQRPRLDQACAEGRICSEPDPRWRDDVPVREEAVPVVREGRVLAVLSRHTNLATARTPSRLELTYHQCAQALTRMVAEGAFPTSGAPTGMRRGAPRVGDGLIRLDADGHVLFASPNAVSGFHRLGFVGDLPGSPLVDVATRLAETPSPVDETLPLVTAGRVPWRTELETRSGALSLRAIPLTEGGRRAGAIVLCRDVSELRRREQELLTKDATIREIHHRVKNNLQTVAALLRLQARRIRSDDGQEALQEAIRRVSTIALVHETLSEGFEETVDFDSVVDRGLLLVADAAGGGSGMQVRRQGRFGTVRAEDASPLALVLVELVTNAAEHGLRGSAGTVTISAERRGEQLTVAVTDDGVGLPEGFSAGGSGLGTQIVTALVTGELRGSIDWQRAVGGGTEVHLEVRLRDGL